MRGVQPIRRVRHPVGVSLPLGLSQHEDLSDRDEESGPYSGALNGTMCWIAAVFVSLPERRFDNVCLVSSGVQTRFRFRH